MNWNVFFETAVGTYLDVMVWVAISLLVFEIINLFTKEKLYRAIENRKRSQVGIAALMGLIPGCGGALMLVPLYNQRKISLAALSAAFIATFGDAAFIILAKSPLIFVNLLWIGFATALVFGYFIELTGLGDFLQKKIDSKKNTKPIKVEKQDNWKEEIKVVPSIIIKLDRVYAPIIIFSMSIFLLPGTIMNLILPFEGNIWISISEWIAMAMTIFAIFLFTVRRIIMKFYVSWTYKDHPHDYPNTAIAKNGNRKDDIKHKVHDIYTNIIFITCWVFVGLFSFNVLFFYSEELINDFFALGGGAIAVLIAITIGLLPGCGPQIALADFFLTTTPFGTLAALSGNSINQDGDAAFTLIATEPGTIATMRVLNLIPALIIGFSVLGIEIFLYK